MQANVNEVNGIGMMTKKAAAQTQVGHPEASTCI